MNKKLYPIKTEAQTRIHYHWHNALPEGEEKDFYGEYVSKICPMTVEAIIVYYQRLIDYPEQNKIVADNLTYAELAEQLRQGSFRPTVDANISVYQHMETLYQSQTGDTLAQADIQANHKPLQYDCLKTRKEINGEIVYEPEFLKINGRYYSWNHPIFKSYI